MGYVCININTYLFIKDVKKTKKIINIKIYKSC